MKQIGFYEGLPLTDKNSFLEKLAETPVPKKRELLVEISAVSVNPVDVDAKTRVFYCFGI